MIKVQKQKINVSEQNRNLLKKKIGAVVNFIGVARPSNNSGKIKYIEIENYTENLMSFEKNAIIPKNYKKNI